MAREIYHIEAKSLKPLHLGEKTEKTLKQFKTFKLLHVFLALFEIKLQPEFPQLKLSTKTNFWKFCKLTKSSSPMRKQTKTKHIQTLYSRDQRCAQTLRSVLGTPKDVGILGIAQDQLTILHMNHLESMMSRFFCLPCQYELSC